jgi:hypothetical protein
MPNVTAQNAGTAGRKVARNGDSYHLLNGYKTLVLSDRKRTRVLFHDTPVVTFDERTIELDSGGWWTRTTKVRMNQASQEFGLGFRVFQKQNKWFVEFQQETLPFKTESILLDRDMISGKRGE